MQAAPRRPLPTPQKPSSRKRCWLRKRKSRSACWPASAPSPPAHTVLTGGLFPAWRPTRLPPPCTGRAGRADSAGRRAGCWPRRWSRGAPRQSSRPHHLPCPGPSRECGQPPRPSSPSPSAVQSAGWASSSLTVSPQPPATGPPQTPAWTPAACSAPAPSRRGPWSIPQRPVPAAPGTWALAGVLGEGREPAGGAGLWVGTAVTQSGQVSGGCPTPRFWAGICSEGCACPPPADKHTEPGPAIALAPRDPACRSPGSSWPGRCRASGRASGHLQAWMQAAWHMPADPCHPDSELFLGGPVGRDGAGLEAVESGSAGEEVGGEHALPGGVSTSQEQGLPGEGGAALRDPAAKSPAGGRPHPA